MQQTHMSFAVLIIGAVVLVGLAIAVLFFFRKD